MKYTATTIVTLMVCALLLDVFWFLSKSTLKTQTPVPEFTQYPAGKERKQAFFAYFVPLIRQENDRILRQREKLLGYFARKDNLSHRDRVWLREIAERYEIEGFSQANDNHWETILRRVDLVPVSLAVAQAANESAWGTSRFARQASNYFGHWCFKKGCGLVPGRRETGKVHEVAKFDSPAESVRKYMLNLNRHYAYQDLRRKRALLRQQNQLISGLALLPTLEQYSERGTHYLRELRQMIRFNNLPRLDRQTNSLPET